MIRDALWMFSEDQDISSSSAGATTVGENVVKAPVGEDAFGDTEYSKPGYNGRLSRWNTAVTTALAGSSAAVTVSLKKSTVVGMSSATVIDTFVIPAATAAGKHYSRPLPIVETGAFLRVDYVIAASATLTAGVVDSWLGGPTEESAL